MSTNIVTFYVQQYAKVLNELVQQKTSRLRKFVGEDKYVGQAASPVEQVGAVAMQPVTQRYGPMQRVDAQTNRRWVYPSDYDLPQLFDNFDKLRLLIDPKSKFVSNAHNAANRQYDDLIIAALGGTAQTGVSGATATALPASAVVSVQQGATAPTGLTVAKLRQAKLILMQQEAFPMRRRTRAIRPRASCASPAPGSSTISWPRRRSSRATSTISRYSRKAASSVSSVSNSSAPSGF